MLQARHRWGDYLVANPNPAQNTAPSVINDPLAPPHTATGIASLVSGISGAKILAAKRHSEPAPALGPKRGLRPKP
ncbi:MAG: hypothetical protein WBE93_20265, partial [Pseudolabrys sp.]